MILGFSGESWDFLENPESFWKIPDEFGQLFCDVEYRCSSGSSRQINKLKIVGVEGLHES